jgi:hypothetical protein
MILEGCREENKIKEDIILPEDTYVVQIFVYLARKIKSLIRFLQNIWIKVLNEHGWAY